MNLSVILLWILVSHPMDPAPGPSVPFWWSAFPEGDNTILVNPAGTSWLKGSSLRIGCVFSDSTFEHFDRVTIEDASGGFSGWWEDNLSLRRFTTSGSVSFKCLSAGAGYTWYDPTVGDHPLSGKKFFTFGLNLRPEGHIGIGATARTAFGEYDPCYIAGLAVRPLGDAGLVLTGDYRFETGDTGSRWSAGAQGTPVQGITLRVSYGEDETISAGLQMDFGRAGLSAGAGFIDGEYTGATTEILMFNQPRRSVISPLPDFLSWSTSHGSETPSRAFLGPRQPSFTEELELLARGIYDPAVKGVLLDMSEFNLNSCQAEELREVLVDYRSAGKPVFAYMEYAGNSSYYTASACRSICMHKAGQVTINGYSGYSFFLRGFLDRIGLYPDLMHIGDYKSASDMLTEYEISDAQIEATTALLETWKDEQVRGISEGRGFEPAQMHLFYSDSPFAGEDMVTTALVDTLLYRDQFEDYVEDQLGRSISSMTTGYYGSLNDGTSRWGNQPKIAVVVATGYIVNGESGSSFMGGMMGSDTIIELLEKAAATPGVEALVLRIDSGGGDAMASDDMRHAVERISERIPVVVSMGSVAASGGYFMACGADAIFADRLTVTGSIGIISGKFTYGGLLEKLGINVERVDIEPSGNSGNPFEPYTEDQYERRFQAMRRGYELFVNSVAEARGMTFEEVDALGQGRVWSGRDALELGLVDYNGGVLDAMDHAARLAGISREEAGVIILPDASGLGTLSFGPLGSVSLTEAVDEFTGNPLITAEGPLYLAPMIVVE